MALHGRYADFIVVGQPDPHAASTGRPVEPPATTLASSGRPLLVVPFAGSFATVGDQVLVGWNASAESARAVNAALPILRRARRVTVLSINPRRGIGGEGDVPAADIVLHLARHGITAEAAHTIAEGISEGDALLSYAADIGADLLVTGLYGHSRVREVVFGGVTQSLMTEMTIPAFMMHLSTPAPVLIRAQSVGALTCARSPVRAHLCALTCARSPVRAPPVRAHLCALTCAHGRAEHGRFLTCINAARPPRPRFAAAYDW